MRTNLKEVLFLVCALTGAALSPVVAKESLESGLTSVSHESVDLIQEEYDLSPARRASAKDVTATVTVDESMNRKFKSASAIGMIDGQWVRVSGTCSENIVTFPSVPEGEWDFYVFYNGTDGMLMLSQEEKKVPLEAPLVFDEAEADIKVEFDFVLPDGSKPVLSLQDSKDKEIIETGNIAYEGRSMHFTHRGMQLFTNTTVFTYRFVNADGSLTQDHLANTLKTNGAKHADASRLSQYAWVGGAVHVQKGAPLVSAKLSNSATDYVMVDTDVAGTAYNDPDSIPDNGMQIVSYDTFNGVAYLWNRTTIKTGLISPEVYGKVFYSGPSGSDVTRYMRYPQPSRILAKITSGRLTTTYCIVAEPFRNAGGKAEFIGLHNSGGGIMSKWVKNSSGDVDIAKHNPWMVAVAEGKTLLGNSTATTVFAPMTQMGVTPFEWGFVGINGEKREIDDIGIKISLTLNGDTLAANKSQLNALFNSWTQALPAEGKVRVEMRNENILIDRMKGYNLMELEYASRGDDSTPPVLQIMRPVAGEKVSDRFDDVSDASIDFVAGDYKFNYIGARNPFYTDFGKIGVKAEYAPHGSDSFSELPASEMTERFWMPGWGHYYRASLATADRKSPDGWFDVRLTLSDEAGNTHRQTFSPAFFVKTLSGVVDVEVAEGVSLTREGSMLIVDGMNNPAIRIMDLTGCVVGAASGRRIDVSGVRPGMYVVEVSDGIFRKVFKRMF